MEGDLEPFDTDMDANLADIRVGLEQSPEICMKADTISELAALTGADFDSLETTIKSYNEACASGMDWECFKDSRFLIPMTPPFYVARSTLRTDGAFGGVAVNPDMNAYAQNGGTVPGLFVAGDFASGRHINLGNLKRQVLNDMSAAMSGGFIAGESAARYVDQLH